MLLGGKLAGGDRKTRPFVSLTSRSFEFCASSPPRVACVVQNWCLRQLHYYIHTTLIVEGLSIVPVAHFCPI